MNPIVKLAASALPGERKYILFAGAGVSKDANIPTSWDLMMKTASLLYAAENSEVDPNINLEEWFLNSKYSKYSYSKLIGQLYPKSPDQRQFLNKYLNGYEIGDSHIGIAELVRREIIRAIITTNFDHYIEQALQRVGISPQVISNDEDLKDSEPLIHCKALRVYKPHGDLERGALKNTPKDLEKLSPLMKKELIRVMSEHGVIVVGYAGNDKGIQRVIQRRNFTYYPLFWVDPVSPKGEIEKILKQKDYTYIKCIGAAQFINDYLKILNRIETIAPVFGKGPTIPDLRFALSSPKEPVVPLYLEFLDIIYNDLEQIRPDFTKFKEIDEAILEQIKEGIPITYRFIEASDLVCQYSNIEAIKTVYHFFDKALKLYDIPDDYQGSYREIDFDGYKFLIFEMFVSFISLLIKYNKWQILGDILSEEFFIEKKRDSKYVPFIKISKYVASLDDLRNKRLQLRRISVMGDLIKDRFENSDLAELVDHKKFMEADYFLFMRTVTHTENLEYLIDVWCHRSCIWLENIPSYIVRAESKKFLSELVKATGFSSEETFLDNFKMKHHFFVRCFKSSLKGDPLEFYDLNKIGSRN